MKTIQDIIYILASIKNNISNMSINTLSDELYSIKKYLLDLETDTEHQEFYICKLLDMIKDTDIYNINISSIENYINKLYTILEFLAD